MLEKRRFMLFAGYHYYPSGGWQDFVGFFDTLDEARKAAANPETGYFATDYKVIDPEWIQIIDTETGNDVS